jgi:formylglycine-generating enzyme required for sulfatase activity
VSEVGAASARLGGTVLGVGGVVVLERGVVVTSGASDPVVGGAGVTKVAVAGTTGVFSVVVDGLQYGTGYRFRAYATSAGGTAYSAVGTFTTLNLAVTGVAAVQRAGTRLVDIDYGVVGMTGPMDVILEASADGGVTWTVPVATVSGAVGSGVAAGAGLRITWDAGTDWGSQYSQTMRFRVSVRTSLGTFAEVSAGGFTMGDALDGDPQAPLRSVQLSRFFMEKQIVTKARWDEVRSWALTNGYGDLGAGEGKAADHPVVSVSWQDAVKFCNARSEREGLVPVYSAAGAVLRTGAAVPVVNWDASGYRLPTEAEWEKAARGGLSGKRFPWGDTITHAQANYYSSSLYGYDVSTTRGYHPVYRVGSQPWTSPAGAFAPNGYGFQDMAGNVWQWCWDWYGAYPGGALNDPRGAATGTERVARGGAWLYYADYCPSSRRRYFTPDYAANVIGLRLVRSVVPVLTATAGTGNVTVSTSDPVQITSQPADLTVVETASAVFTVTATGTGPLSYQWRRDGVALPGQSGPALTLAPVRLEDAARYSVAVTNLTGTLLSREALLVVRPASAADVVAVQRPGSKLIDVTYSIPGNPGPVLVMLQASADGGVSWNVPVRTVTGSVGAGVLPGTGLKITWDAGADWNEQASANMRFRVLVEPARAGLSLIPPGLFTMGDSLDGSEEPHPVTVSAFHLAQRPVTSAEWGEVRTWATSRGYSDLAAGEGKAGNHPIVGVTWWDVVKWCNARSERDGLTPCYTSGGNVFKTGTVVPSVSWSANGYRLPTEAEWEKAARGGLAGKRFPWGDTITHAQANYFSDAALPYDQSPTRGYHPQWGTGAQPWSSPVGTYGANAYGLTDMAGNVWQWCWDWFGPYDLEAATDPRGASQGSDRIFRGGGWGNSASLCRSAFRGYYPPTYRSNAIGFRVARSSVLNGVSAGAQVHTGAQYGIVPADHTWQSAADDAGRRGGRLAIVSTEARIARVQSVLEEFGAARHGSLWIALSREAGSWRWSDGEPLAAANWAPGQPSAWGSRAWILGTGENRGKWTSQETAMAGYVIEFPWSELKPGAPVANGAVTGYGDYEPGTSAVLTAAAAPGFRFEGWTGDATGLENPLTVLMDRSRVISPQFVPDVPDLSVEQPDGVVIAPNGILDGFRTTKPSERIIVRSSGSGTLRGVAWELRGTASADYLVSPALPGTMAPGTSAELEIRFTPSAPGMRDAELRIASNDADGPFVIFLRGRESTASEVWRHTHFGTPENAGEAADASDPDRDGISNLMEFATGSHPKEFSPDPGEVVRNGGVLEYRYWRAKSALAELNFVREFATGPTGPWSQTGGLVETILSDDGSRQRVLVTTPASAAIEKRFVRLRVSRK